MLHLNGSIQHGRVTITTSKVKVKCSCNDDSKTAMIYMVEMGSRCGPGAIMCHNVFVIRDRYNAWSHFDINLARKTHKVPGLLFAEASPYPTPRNVNSKSGEFNIRWWYNYNKTKLNMCAIYGLHWTSPIRDTNTYLTIASQTPLLHGTLPPLHKAIYFCRDKI